MKSLIRIECFFITFLQVFQCTCRLKKTEPIQSDHYYYGSGSEGPKKHGSATPIFGQVTAYEAQFTPALHLYLFAIHIFQSCLSAHLFVQIHIYVHLKKQYKYFIHMYVFFCTGIFRVQLSLSHHDNKGLRKKKYFLFLIFWGIFNDNSNFQDSFCCLASCHSYCMSKKSF